MTTSGSIYMWLRAKEARWDPRLLGERLCFALEVVLRGAADRRGLVLLVDDAHHIDIQSARVLRRSIRGEGAAPMHGGGPRVMVD